MGREKRILLLAVMILLIGTNGYGKTVTEKETYENNRLLEVTTETGIINSGTFINNNTIEIEINKETGVFGVNNNKGTSTNNGVIKTKENNKGTAVKVSNGTFINSENGKMELNGQSGKGIFVSRKTAVVENKGEILINCGTGINIANGTVTNEKNATIIIEKTNNGILLAGENSTFNNDGAIVIEKDATVGENNAIVVKNGKFTNNGTITNEDKISISGGTFTNSATGTITNTGVINVTNGKFINNKGTFHNETSGKIIASGTGTDGIRIGTGGKFTNKGTVEVIGEEELTASKSQASGIKLNETATFDNEGTINVKGTEKGTIAGSTASSIYSGYQPKGINVNSANASAENSGVINVERYGIGVATKGTFTNKNLINVKNQSIGINVIDSGKGINNKYITTDNKSYGAQVAKNGTFTNEKEGEIKVNSGSTGITASTVTDDKLDVNEDGTKKENAYTDIKNEGSIFVSGDNSTGMQANQNRKVTNTGLVYIDAAKFTSGLKAAGKNALAENNGELIIIGDGKNTSNGMIAQTGGKVVTNGTEEKRAIVSASGATTSAISASGESSTAENGEYGVINVLDNATGMKIESSGIGENNGEIEVQSGKGVTVSNSIFVNSGTIDAGKNGIAIQNIGSDKAGNKFNNTVYLKDGSKITGNIVGAEGIDVLGFGEGTYSGLDVKNYEALTVRNGDVKIENSSIGLEYNTGTEKYLTEANGKMDSHDYPDKKPGDMPSISGNLTMSGSTLAINFKDSLTDKNLENPIIKVEKDGTLTFEEGMTLVFDSSDGRTEFNLNEALGLEKGQININGNLDDAFNKTVVWDYHVDSEGNLIAEKENYDQIISKSQLNEFVNLLDKQEIGKTEIGKTITKLETIGTKEEFSKAITQLSGGLHGYTVDFAALNARTLVNTMRDRALTRDYIKNRPVGSYTQDFVYIDNNHRLGGLMDVNYDEKGVLGITEKQILPNGRVGIVYGGSTGNTKFDGGESGSASLDGIYAGGYYNHEFNDKWSLNSNASFIYTHNRVTREIEFGEGENKVDKTFKSNYPIYSVGVGTSLIYTVKDDLRNKAYFYAGIDANRIMQGMINEEEDKSFTDANELAVRKQGYVNDKSYYSIVPSAGFMAQNTGYIFDRKYRIGAGLNWETEIGNIKDGKRLNMKGISSEYKVETAERENVFSYSLFGALDLTENLAVNAKYSSIFSDEYDADLVSAGFEYKIDTMADNMIFGPIISALENRRKPSERWGGTFSIMLENEDNSDRAVYNGSNFIGGGDYATSNQYKPKFVLSLNDKLSNWSYYFEGYWKDNALIKTPKGNEEKQHATRLHGEARWKDSYSKGDYGLNIAYRNETADKPNLTTTAKPRRSKRGVHQLRVTPNFTYELGNGFTFTSKTTGIFEYHYTGDKESQLDYLMEQEHGIIYTGFMPKWKISVIYYRDDRWFDGSNRKAAYDKGTKLHYYDYDTAERQQLGQIRPNVTYYFGNGASFEFSARIPLGNGEWSIDKNGNKGGEEYESRYGFEYNHPVSTGMIVTVGGTFLNIKAKETDGDITRSHSFRPSIGFSYSF